MRLNRPLVFCGTIGALTLSALTGCGSRNLYKNVRLENPPLEHAYTHVTRPAPVETGKDPVEFGSPAASKDLVFIQSESKGIEAFERNLFRRRWFLPIKNGASSQTLLENGTLYFGGGDGFVYALDAELGTELWKYETRVPVYARPTVYGDRVYINSSDDVIYSLDRESGKWAWHYKRGGSFITTVRGNSAPAVDEKFLYAGFSDGYVVALNAKDGNLAWEQKIHKGSKFTDVDAMPVIDGNTLYVPSYDGELYALDKRNGKVIWHVDTGGSRRVIVDDQSIYLASSLGKIVALNKTSGRVQWQFELDNGTPTSLVSHDNYLAFGSSQQYFYAIHKGDGTLAYRHSAGVRSGFASTPSEFDQDLFILSNHGNLYVFRWKSQSHQAESTKKRVPRS